MDVDVEAEEGDIDAGEEVNDSVEAEGARALWGCDKDREILLEVELV